MSSFTKTLSLAIREIRVLCSQMGTASVGTREFILSRYPAIKQHLPVLIRDASGTPARILARFERGLEKNVELDHLSVNEVETKVIQLLGL